MPLGGHESIVFAQQIPAVLESGFFLHAIGDSDAQRISDARTFAFHAAYSLCLNCYPESPFLHVRTYPVVPRFAFACEIDKNGSVAGEVTLWA